MRRFILPLLLVALSLTTIACDENGNGIEDAQETGSGTNTDLGAQASRPTVACPIGRNATGACTQHPDPKD
jgi:hypothetical protein